MTFTNAIDYKKTMRDHFLYVVKCGPYYKIGITNNVKKRVESFRIGNPFKIKRVLTHKIPYVHARFVESTVHASLETYKIRNEWFCARPRDIKSAIADALEKVDERHARYVVHWEKVEQHSARGNPLDSSSLECASD